MKRILYVGGFELPDKNAAAHRVLGNAKALRELGYEVIFLDVDKDFQGNCLSEEHDTEGFRTFSQRHANDLKGLFRYASTPLYVEEILELFDDWEAVIAYNYPSIALDKLRKIGKRRGIKVYADCTEWYGLDRLTLRDAIVFLDSTVRMRIVHKKLDGVICISRYLEDYYRKHTKTVIIPPLVDKADLKWSLMDRENGSLHFLYSGSPGYQKDRLDKIISAVCDCAGHCDLTIIGLSEREYLLRYPKERNRVRMLAASGKLKFLGRLPHKVTLDYLKRANFSIFFRTRTRTTMAGFPTKFVESISCAVPVITTDTSDLNQYIHDGLNGLLLPQDRFSDALCELIDSGGLTYHSFHVENDCFDYRKFIERFRFFNGALL